MTGVSASTNDKLAILLQDASEVKQEMFNIQGTMRRVVFTAVAVSLSPVIIKVLGRSDGGDIFASELPFMWVEYPFSKVVFTAIAIINALLIVQYVGFVFGILRLSNYLRDVVYREIKSLSGDGQKVFEWENYVQNVSRASFSGTVQVVMYTFAELILLIVLWIYALLLWMSQGAFHVFGPLEMAVSAVSLIVLSIFLTQIPLIFRDKFRRLFGRS